MSEDDKSKGSPDVPPQGSDKELATLKREAAERRVTNQKLQDQLDAIEAKKAEDAKMRAEEQGKYQELYESKEQEVSGLKDRAEAAEAALDKYFESEIAGIPEEKQALIPDMDTASKLAWFQKAKAAGMFGDGKGKTPEIKPSEDPNKIDLSGMSPVEKANYARQKRK